MDVSSDEQMPSPHLLLQSWGQNCGSVGPQNPSPQYVQSFAQMELSPGSQTPLPHEAGQSLLHVAGVSVVPQNPSPQ